MSPFQAARYHIIKKTGVSVADGENLSYNVLHYHVVSYVHSNTVSNWCFFSQDESLFVVCRHVHSCQELRPAVMIAQKGVCMGIDQSALTWPLATKHHLNIQGSAETMF